MTVRLYMSSDASAPTLNGTVGSLITVLDACLVNGYGAKAAAGWAKEFSGTNLAAYRPPSGNRFRLRIDDTAAQEGRAVGYETMGSISDTSGNAFPTSSQASGGLFIRKSNTADSTARPWVLLATETAFYFFPYSGVTGLAAGAAGTNAANCSGHFFFGDLVSFKAGDAFATMIIGAVATSTPVGRIAMMNSPAINNDPALTGHFIARAYTQTGTSISVGKVTAGMYTSITTLGAISSSLPSYPDQVSGGLPIAPVEVVESGSPSSAYLIRGRMPGLWGPTCSQPGSQGDTFTGSGELAGKSFMVVETGNVTTVGRAIIETSDTW